jgi:hypothetical protein
MNSLYELGVKGIVSGNAYKDGYIVSDTIKPRSGYWVKASTTGELILSNVLRRTKFIEKQALNDEFNSLTFQDDRGLERTLFFGHNIIEWILSYYELPPLPPDGIFDVRFISQRDVESIQTNSTDFTLPISIQSRSHSLKIKYNIIHNESIYSLLLPNKQTIDLQTTGLIEITPPFDKVILNAISQSQQSKPTAFKLEQNYPNPFNPVTMIQYEIPVASQIRIKIYDLSGKEIAILANEKREPGRYEIKFDGSGLPSGIYFYRLITDEFESTKKLILLK